MSHRSGALLIVVLTTLGLAACGEPGTGPNQPLSPSESSSLSAVNFSDANVSADWNERATALAAHAPVNVTRLYAYLSLAQLRAGEDASAIHSHPPTGAAIGAASAGVLKAFFPAFAGVIDAELAAQAAALQWSGAKFEDFEGWVGARERRGRSRARVRGRRPLRAG